MPSSPFSGLSLVVVISNVHCKKNISMKKCIVKKNVLCLNTTAGAENTYDVGKRGDGGEKEVLRWKKQRACQNGAVVMVV